MSNFWMSKLVTHKITTKLWRVYKFLLPKSRFVAPFRSVPTYGSNWFIDLQVAGAKHKCHPQTFAPLCNCLRKQNSVSSKLQFALYCESELLTGFDFKLLYFSWLATISVHRHTGYSTEDTVTSSMQQNSPREAESSSAKGFVSC